MTIIVMNDHFGKEKILFFVVFILLLRIITEPAPPPLY